MACLMIPMTGSTVILRSRDSWCPVSVQRLAAHNGGGARLRVVPSLVEIIESGCRVEFLGGESAVSGWRCGTAAPGCFWLYRVPERTRPGNSVRGHGRKVPLRRVALPGWSGLADRAGEETVALCRHGIREPHVLILGTVFRRNGILFLPRTASCQGNPPGLSSRRGRFRSPHRAPSLAATACRGRGCFRPGYRWCRFAQPPATIWDPLAGSSEQRTGLPRSGARRGGPACHIAPLRRCVIPAIHFLTPRHSDATVSANGLPGLRPAS